MKPIHIEVVLGVFTPSPDLNVKDPHILVSETDSGIELPNAALPEQESSLDVAARILKEAAGLDAKLDGTGWIDLIPVGVADSANRKRCDVRSIAIPYGALVPFTFVTPGEGLRWLPVTECLRRVCVEDHKEIMVAICQRV